jgi:hypothetical protein
MKSKNMVESERPQMMAWHMRFARWVNKATRVRITPTQPFTHTHARSHRNIYNTCWFSTATIVTRTLLNVSFIPTLSALHVSASVRLSVLTGPFPVLQPSCVSELWRTKWMTLKSLDPGFISRADNSSVNSAQYIYVISMIMLLCSHLQLPFIAYKVVQA